MSVAPGGAALADLATAVATLAADDPTTVPVAALGEQVTALSHLLDRLEAQRLRRLAVFDRAGGAAADGAGSTAAWLRDRAGLTPGAARERVAVARELTDTRPLTAAALATGRISYTAAKEIALGLRDTPASVPAAAADAVEPVLVEQAPALAPGDIRRLLTRTLQALAPDALLAREQQVHHRRGLRLSPLGDNWVLTGDLTGECGAALDVALRALTAAQQPADDTGPRPTLAQRRHDALQTLTRRLLDSDHLPDARPATGGDTWTAGTARPSPAATAAGQDTRASGPAHADEDSDPTRVEGAARAGDVPDGDSGAAGVGAEPRGFVAAPAPGPVRLSDTGGERPHLLVIADLAALQASATGARGTPPGSAPPPRPLVPAAELHGSGPISSHLVRRLGCDASLTRIIVDTRPPPGAPDAARPATGAPGTAAAGLDLAAVKALLPPALGGPVSTVVDVGRRPRTVPPATRRAILARDRGCRWPGCNRPMSDGEVHHVRHWADGGPTDLWNLLLLCWSHHRLLHEGGWSLRLRSDGSLELLRPDGSPVLDLAASPRQRSSRPEPAPRAARAARARAPASPSARVGRRPARGGRRRAHPTDPGGSR